MAKAKIKCRLCYTERKSTSKNFPLAIHDKSTKAIIGYICRLCIQKARRYEQKQLVMKKEKSDFQKLPPGQKIP